MARPIPQEEREPAHQPGGRGDRRPVRVQLGGHHERVEAGAMAGEGFRDADESGFKARAVAAIFADIEQTLASLGVRFDAYFNADGSVSSSEKSIRGFWNTVERKGMEFFCYALDGIPARPSQLVECFPIAAMAIPRFAEQLWTSKPTEGVTLHGGIMAGRP